MIRIDFNLICCLSINNYFKHEPDMSTRTDLNFPQGLAGAGFRRQPRGSRRRHHGSAFTCCFAPCPFFIVRFHERVILQGVFLSVIRSQSTGISTRAPAKQQFPVNFGRQEALLIVLLKFFLCSFPSRFREVTKFPTTGGAYDENLRLAWGSWQTLFCLAARAKTWKTFNRTEHDSRDLQGSCSLPGSKPGPNYGSHGGALAIRVQLVHNKLTSFHTNVSLL